MPPGVDYDMWVGPAEFVPYQANRFHYHWHWWYDFGVGGLGVDGPHEVDYARWGLGVETHPTTVAGLGGKYYFDDDQEFRVATPIAVKQGGAILDADGRRNEPQVWGNAADWCDYSGTIAGRHAGITIMGDPRNFRKNRHHARNYGALVANPFGQQSFGKGPLSEVVVKPGESFRLRYGVLLHSGPPGATPDLKAAFADFLSLL